MFEKNMTVKDIIALIGHNNAYEIRGAYSGKYWYKSYYHSNKKLERLLDREVTDKPIYTHLVKRGDDMNEWVIPVIVIWMYDIDLVEGE